MTRSEDEMLPRTHGRRASDQRYRPCCELASQQSRRMLEVAVSPPLSAGAGLGLMFIAAAAAVALLFAYDAAGGASPAAQAQGIRKRMVNQSPSARCLIETSHESLATEWGYQR